MPGALRTGVAADSWAFLEAGLPLLAQVCRRAAVLGQRLLLAAIQILAARGFLALSSEWERRHLQLRTAASPWLAGGNKHTLALRSKRYFVWNSSGDGSLREPRRRRLESNPGGPRVSDSNPGGTGKLWEAIEPWEALGGNWEARAQFKTAYRVPLRRRPPTRWRGT